VVELLQAVRTSVELACEFNCSSTGRGSSSPWNFTASALTASTRVKASLHRRARLSDDEAGGGIELLPAALGHWHTPIRRADLNRGAQRQIEFEPAQGLEHLLTNWRPPP